MQYGGSFAQARRQRYTGDMSQEIRAIYENGMFRPLDPVLLGEHDVVSIVIAPAAAPNSNEADATQHHSLVKAIETAGRLPLESADDGFSGADHDEVLYGWKK